MLKLRIAVTNLGKYNEGHLQYEWLELPCTNIGAEEVLEEIGINSEYEEYFISDYESNIDIEIGVYENIRRLNNLAHKINSLCEHDFKKLRAMLEWDYDKDLSWILENINELVLMEDILSESDLGYEVVKDYNLPSFIENAIDFRALGRDELTSTNGKITSFGYVVRL